MERELALASALGLRPHDLIVLGLQYLEKKLKYQNGAIPCWCNGKKVEATTPKNRYGEWFYDQVTNIERLPGGKYLVTFSYHNMIVDVHDIDKKILIAWGRLSKGPLQCVPPAKVLQSIGKNGNLLV